MYFVLFLHVYFFNVHFCISVAFAFLQLEYILQYLCCPVEQRWLVVLLYLIPNHLSESRVRKQEEHAYFHALVSCQGCKTVISYPWVFSVIV